MLPIEKKPKSSLDYVSRLKLKIEIDGTSEIEFKFGNNPFFVL
jgi:hypothetical protein